VTTGQTGSIGLSLMTAPGVTVDSVGFTITGMGMSTLSGSLAAGDGTGNTFMALLNGVPAGSARHLVLTADASNGTVCKGEATIDVFVGQTSEVTVQLDCRGDAGGAILVNGSLDQCPRIQSVMAAPASAPVGGAISVSATASDLDDPITIMWTASSGSFTNAAASATHFVCGAAGTAKLTATVTDARGCSASVSINVMCTAADGGAACGDGVIESPEMCDGTNLNGATCAPATMNAAPGGVLACSPSCTLDTSGCTAAGGAGGAGGIGGTMGSGGARDAGAAAGGTGGTM